MSQKIGGKRVNFVSQKQLVPWTLLCSDSWYPDLPPPPPPLPQCHQEGIENQKINADIEPLNIINGRIQILSEIFITS